MKTKNTSKTPKQLGYAMPAEWEPHHGTIIAWPHNENDWPGKFPTITYFFADFIRHLSQVENVYVLCNSDANLKRMQNMCQNENANMQNICALNIPSDRVWLRDSGPIFVTRKRAGKTEVALLHWGFNAWAKYPDFLKDRNIPQLFSKAFGNPWPIWQPCDRRGKRVILEGGSIEVNGQGTLMTTEECLLSQDVQARNPQMTKDEIEKTLKQNLGITDIIWLKNGIKGDDTHGHIDDFARFVNADTIVIAYDKNEPNLCENEKILKNYRTSKGKKFRIVRLPMPSTKTFQDVVLPASYANFYIANGIVLVPTFNDPNDRIALNTLAKLFPTRKVIGLYAQNLVLGFGALHCMTQQIPAGAFPTRS